MKQILFNFFGKTAGIIQKLIIKLLVMLRIVLHGFRQAVKLCWRAVYGCWRAVISFFRNGILPVFMVFGHDLRAIFRNPAAFIIVIGLCLLPSLYAWINIYACWDPYSNTGNLPVAIVNHDEGAVFNGKVVNVGNDIVEELQKNKSVGWSFVDDWQGNYGLNEGKYYALIEIPRNFSSGLVSMSTPTPQKPAITYRVNEKLNAIAAKITNVAKDKLVNNIKSTFIKTVAEQSMEIVKNTVDETSFSSARASELRSALETFDDNISHLKEHLSESRSASESFQKYLQETQNTIPKMVDEIDNLQKLTSASKSLALYTQQTMLNLSSDLNSDVSQLQELDRQNQALISTIKSIHEVRAGSDTADILKQSSNICSSADIMLKADMTSLLVLSSNNHMKLLYESLGYLDKLVLEQKDTLDQLIPLIEANASREEINRLLDALSGISSEVSTQIQTVSNSFYTSGSTVLNAKISNLTTQLDDVGSILDVTKSLLPQLNGLVAFGSAGSQLTVQESKKLTGLLTSIQDSLDGLTGKMNILSDKDIDLIIDIVKNRPETVADFLSSPIDVKSEEVFAGGTFGVGLTPFYTVLAIWVGALLACALLSVQCEDEICGIRLNLKQKHFGKMLLFLCISLIQATIVTLGDVVILGVHPADFELLLKYSTLCAVTFTIMIFTLVSLWGNVGKAIAVVIMVFQIAGSGGIYPIQTNPKVFGMLSPFWPFTYAIEGFREAIAGPIWPSVQHNIRALLLFAAGFLLLSSLKKPFHRLNNAMEEKFEEAEL